MLAADQCAEALLLWLTTSSQVVEDLTPMPHWRALTSNHEPSTLSDQFLFHRPTQQPEVGLPP